MPRKLKTSKGTFNSLKEAAAYFNLKPGTISYRLQSGWTANQAVGLDPKPEKQVMLGKTTQQYILEAQKIHGKKYNYAKTVYKGARAKVTIICRVHGEFKQDAGSHLADHGCPKCSFEKVSEQHRKPPERFIEEALAMHDSKYTYEGLVYINSDTKINISCPIHGIFAQTPASHLSGKGCPSCSKNKKLSKSEFIDRARAVHGHKFSYEEFIYVNANTKGDIICPVHGKFAQTPSAHLNGRDCLLCSYEPGLRKSKKTTEEFVADSRVVHGDKYDYSKAEYLGSHDSVIIICPDHGEFPQTATDHLSGNGCKHCHFKGEAKLVEVLNSFGINFSTQFKIQGKRYDFYLPDHKLVIERDGEQHYKEVYFSGSEDNQTRGLSEEIANDKLKTELVLKEGLRMARIPFWLDDEDLRIEISNILAGEPTYPSIPNLTQLEAKPKPQKRG